MALGNGQFTNNEREIEKMEGITGFIQPIELWNGIENIGEKTNGNSVTETGSVFQSVLQNVVGQVQETQADVENKQYLLATGQLDDAHALPIAQTKAELSIELLVTLRNKALESYNELMKMSV